MGIAVGIFLLGATKLEIHLGGNFTPPPRWTSEGVKNPEHRRVKKINKASNNFKTPASGKSSRITVKSTINFRPQC